MGARGICWGIVAFVVVITPGFRADAGDKPTKPKGDELAISEPVACRVIDGYELFEPLDDAAITSDEKLKVYFRPLSYKIDRDGKQYVARFSQDGAIRPKGEKKVVWKKDNLLDYEAKSDTPPYQVYLTNSIGLKGLPPGEYELTITLRDLLRDEMSATQTLAFKIVPARPAPLTTEESRAKPAAKAEPKNSKTSG